MWINQLEKSKDVIAQSQAVAGERDLAVHYGMDLGVLRVTLRVTQIMGQSFIASLILPILPCYPCSRHCLLLPERRVADGIRRPGRLLEEQARLLQGEGWITAG